MNIIKKIFTILICVYLMFIIFEVNDSEYVNAAESVGSMSRLSPTCTPEPTPIVSGDFLYSVYSDKGASIKGYIGKDEDIVIPDTIDGHTVIGICSYAFKDVKNLNSITVANTIDYISNYAFADCKDVKEIYLPEGIKGISYCAFFNCVSLESISIPSSVTYIGNKVFYNTYNLKEISVHENNTNYKSVDGVLFNESMTELIKYPSGFDASEYIIPDGIVSIHDSAFSSTEALINIELPNSVKSIGNAAFTECKNLVNINIPTGISEIDYNTFSYCNSLLKLTIPESVSTIEYNAFRYCDSLKEIVIEPNNENYVSDNGVVFTKDKSTLVYYPDGKEERMYSVPEGVLKLEKCSFINSKYLEMIEISASVTDIDYSCFMDSVNLSSIIVDDNNVNYSSNDGVLFNEDKTILYRYPQGKKDSSYIVSDTVNKIYTRAFIGCSYIENVEISDSVTNIGISAFQSCSSLKRVSISGNVSMLPYSLFSSCELLETVIIPSGVNEIQSYVFNDCNNFTIYGQAGSFVEEYAFSNGYIFSTDAPPEYIVSDPTMTPTVIPTVSPIIQPTVSPIIQPTETPSVVPTELPIEIGDVNEDGNIDAKDALLVLEHAAKIQTIDVNIADVDHNNNVDAKDALLILKLAAKLIESF